MSNIIQKNKLILIESFKMMMLQKKELKFFLLSLITWDTINFFLNFLRESTYSNYVEIINFFTPLVAIFVSITIFIKPFSTHKIIKQRIINLLYPFVFGSFFFCLLHLFTKYFFPESAINHLILQPDSITIFSRTFEVENPVGVSENFINPPGKYLSFSQITYFFYLPLIIFSQFSKRVNIIKSKSNVLFYAANAEKTLAAITLIVMPIITLLLIVFASPNYSSYAYLLFSTVMGGMTPIFGVIFLSSSISLEINRD